MYVNYTSIQKIKIDFFSQRNQPWHNLDMQILTQEIAVDWNAVIKANSDCQKPWWTAFIQTKVIEEPCIFGNILAGKTPVEKNILNGKNMVIV